MGYIGMHDYHGSVEGLRRKVDGAAKRYGRKIWISEIAITNYGNPTQRSVQDAYLTELLPYLDNSENVFRYSWYAARNCPTTRMEEAIFWLVMVLPLLHRLA